MQIHLSGIEQSYGSQTLFHGLDLGIPSGSLFTLLGPSGCGKTTLLRMLAGFVRPDHGKVLFGQTDMTRVPVHKRNVGMVFQDYALFPDRSVLDNVSYGLLARGQSRSQARVPALEMLARVGLKDKADALPSALSGGQRQRVAMARALVIKPDLLLLDEPLSALDAKLRTDLREMLRDLQQEAGITTVFVTHDQEEALSVSDYIAVMDRGCVRQVGTPEQIYRCPDNSFVADFVGGANLIELQEELGQAADGCRRFRTAGCIVRIQSAGRFSEQTMLAVRPETLSVDALRPLEEGDIAARIESVDYRGPSTAYQLRTEFGFLKAVVWNTGVSQSWERGDAVVLRVPESALLVERT